jgi:hypothetical protein
MTAFFLLIVDVLLGLLAYMIFICWFIPTRARNAFYAKLKAKEVAELDKKLGLNEYFGAKIDELEK